MKKSLILTAVLAVAVLCLGCASEPTQEIQAANEAYQKLTGTEVTDYAPEAVANANRLKSDLEAELDAQREAFVLSRSYEDARALAVSLKESSEKALEEARAGRERASAEAQAEIAAARLAMKETRDLMAEAPVGKGTRADMHLFKSDLDGLEMTIGDAQRLLDEGRFLEARAKAQAAKDGIEPIRTQLLEARSKTAGQVASRA